jgi:hypothetical protein
MKKSIISKIVTVILKIILCLGSISLFFVPYIYDFIGKYQDIAFNDQTILYKVALYISAVLVLYIIFELIKIFSLVYKENPFNKNTEYSLKRIAIVLMILSLITLIKSIFIPTVLSFSIFIILFVGSLGVYVLSQVFKAAIEYKNEIDYTV